MTVIVNIQMVHGKEAISVTQSLKCASVRIFASAPPSLVTLRLTETASFSSDGVQTKGLE